MAGLLDMDRSTAMGLLMAGGQMMNTPRNQGGFGAIGNGLLGFAQGMLDQQKQEKDDARQALQDARQARLDESNLALQQAQAQHYLTTKDPSGNPSWQYISTPQGIIRGNIHSQDGAVELVTGADGKPYYKTDASPELAGQIEGQRQANKPIDINNPDGSVSKMLGGTAFPNLLNSPPNQPAPQQNQTLPQSVLQDGSYHDLADYLPFAQQLAPNVMQVESGGNPNAVSETNAQGLMQVIPSTGRAPGYNVIPLQNKSPEENTRFGTDYLAAMLKKNNGNVPDALRDYNGNSDPQYVNKVMNASPNDKVIAASKALVTNAQQGYQAAVDAGANPTVAKGLIHESLQAGADNFASGTPVYHGLNLVDKLRIETEAKRKQDENKSYIELNQKQAEGVNKKTNSANQANSIIDQAEPLLQTATNSGIGALADNALSFFGQSSKGADSAAALKALSANLVMQMPRMEGPQSDKDVQLYKDMAGQIGDPWIPKSQKVAAVQTIKLLNSKYLESVSAQSNQSASQSNNGGWSIKRVE